MSIQAALVFLHTMRQRPGLQAQIVAWGPATTTSQLIELANQMGFACSAAELQTAFRHDWSMRWLHHASYAKSEGRSTDEV